MIGDHWTVTKIQHYKNGRRMGDGDTTNVLTVQMRLLGHRLYWVQEVDWLSVRAITVDTPEWSTPLGPTAASQTTAWLERAMAMGPLSVYLYDSAGWDRLLGDFVNAEGESLSEWLMRPIELGGCGYPAYQRGT